MPLKFERIPDYPSDLNACHEMEKHLPEPLWKYNREIERLMQEAWERNDFEPVEINFISAPASIRAEAFLRTLNLWTE